MNPPVNVAELDDCPMCLSVGSVRADRCQVCDARLDSPDSRTPGSGSPNGTVDLPPAASRGPTETTLGPIRFSDLLEELETIAAMAEVPDGGRSVAAACRRAEAMAESLRAQLFDDIPRNGG